MDRLANTSFLSFLSPALQKDQFFAALAKSLDPLLADFLVQIGNNRILCDLANQPEEVLDLLAVYHFNLDVYSLSFSYSQKLLFVQRAILDKIVKGTPAAVKATLSTAFSYAEVVEWWQDDPTGTTVVPNTFRIRINDPVVDPAKVTAMIRAIFKAKNARSYLSGIASFTSAPPATIYLQGNVAEYDLTVVPYAPTVNVP
jgi:phage tail P2-like protein